jgi:phosphatidylethanolamine-binding protein
MPKPFLFLVSRYLPYTLNKMRTSKSIEAALALIEKDESKILGLSIGTHKNLQPGALVPKAGQQPLTLSIRLINPSATC